MYFRSDLDDRQIFRSDADMENRDGLEVNMLSPPKVLSIFSDPKGNGKAVLLIVSDDFQYKLYRMQIRSSIKKHDPPFCVVVQLWLEGEAENDGEIFNSCFLASCSLNFDLVGKLC